MHPSKALAMFAVLTTAASAWASVDTSPKPGGVYRLKPGIYVQKGVTCESAPNAAIRRYDGQAISDAHTHACRVRVLSRHGNRFEVLQSCIDAGTGPAPRVTERQTISVSDALTFTQRSRGGGTTYRYCPSNMLPHDLGGAAK